MGEALIVRRGGSGAGGGVGFALEKVQTIQSFGGSTSSSALDPSATYVLSLSAGNAEDGELDVESGVFVLENGTITAIHDGDSFLSKKAVAFNATTNKVSVKCVGTYFGSTWGETILVICKVG